MCVIITKFLAKYSNVLLGKIHTFPSILCYVLGNKWKELESWRDNLWLDHKKCVQCSRPPLCYTSRFDVSLAFRFPS